MQENALYFGVFANAPNNSIGVVGDEQKTSQISLYEGIRRTR